MKTQSIMNRQTFGMAYKINSRELRQLPAPATQDFYDVMNKTGRKKLLNLSEGTNTTIQPIVADGKIQRVAIISVPQNMSALLGLWKDILACSFHLKKADQIDYAKSIRFENFNKQSLIETMENTQNAAIKKFGFNKN